MTFIDTSHMSPYERDVSLLAETITLTQLTLCGVGATPTMLTALVDRLQMRIDAVRAHGALPDTIVIHVDKPLGSYEDFLAEQFREQLDGEWDLGS